MTSETITVVDTGPLLAAFDDADADHAAVVRLLATPGQRFVVGALCVAEACHLAERDHGPPGEALLLAGLGTMEVLAPEPSEWARIAALVRQYADLRLGGTDASLIVLAERLDTDRILTFDRRHFSVVRPRHCPAFRLLPERLSR